MAILGTMNPAEKKALMFGAPIVGILVVWKLLSSKSTASTTPTAPADTSTIQSGQGDVLGVGQLASFEDTIAAQLNTLSNQINQPTPAAPAPPAAPTPDTQQQAFVAAAQGLLGQTAQTNAQNLINYINAGHPQGLPPGTPG